MSIGIKAEIRELRWDSRRRRLHIELFVPTKHEGAPDAILVHSEIPAPSRVASALMAAAAYQLHPDLYNPTEED